MSHEQKDRRAALDGLVKILDAGALEELFTGPDEEALGTVPTVAAWPPERL